MGTFRDNMMNLFMKGWYWYVSKIDKNAEITFMNYGYADDSEVKLNEADSKNRYPLQLYHHVASPVDLKGLHIAEVGCGRGGGADYVARTFQPKSMIGMDLNQKATEFCKTNYKVDGLRFQQGDAMNIEFPENEFDALINVESSHRYPDFPLFLKEVYRVLKPGGHFLFTDFRWDFEMEKFEADIQQSGLKLIKRTDITANVVRSLENDDARKRDIIKRLAPFFAKKVGLEFAAVVGSKTFEEFKTRKYFYISYVLQKA